MNPANMLTKYDLTQPTEMHRDYGWWRIKRDGCELADVQNQHEGIKIVEELQRQADEVHALRAEVERLEQRFDAVRDAVIEGLHHEVALLKETTANLEQELKVQADLNYRLLKENEHLRMDEATRRARNMLGLD